MCPEEAPPDDLTAPEKEQVSLLLERISGGDELASNELLPIVYDELRRVARWRMRRERPGQTLQTTALVHEAYLRLLGDGSGDDPAWSNRRHFFGAAAEAMRRILIERARRYSRHKHGGDQERVDFEVAAAIAGSPGADAQSEDLLALDEALQGLEEHDAEMALIVKLKHFGGFKTREIVEALGIPERSVERKWSVARAWLKRELSR